MRAPRPAASGGNLQAWARELRYREAQRVARDSSAARARTRGGVSGESDEPPLAT